MVSRLTLANGCLLGSSKAHYELVDRPELAEIRQFAAAHQFAMLNE